MIHIAEQELEPKSLAGLEQKILAEIEAIKAEQEQIVGTANTVLGVLNKRIERLEEMLGIKHEQPQQPKPQQPQPQQPPDPGGPA